MSIFKKILQKLGFSKSEEELAEERKAKTSPQVDISKYVSKRGFSNKSTEMEMVDVESQLDMMAAETSQELDWKMSIVDLLKLLDMDSSYEARKELAIELDCPPENMDDSARMNVWLHKSVMQELAANGGKVPKELLD
jgi:hypothetical protein